jgi:hypothetical protein
LVTDQFIAEFPTPGVARAVALYNGLAYAADSDEGLQVISYTRFDAGNEPPSVSFSVGDGSGNVELGQTALVAVEATDDIQVRHVELLVNGEVVERDGNFPFEFYFTPEQTLGSSSVLQVTAVDTTGNAASAPAQTVDTVVDTQGPIITASTPGQDEDALEVSTISLFVNEEIDPESVSKDNFTLTSYGVIAEPGKETPVDVPIASAALVNGRTIVVTPVDVVPYGQNVLSMAAGSIRDLAGNTAVAPYTLSFNFIAPKVPLEWIGADGANWSDPANWSQGRVPTGDDSVIINPPSDPIVIRNGDFTVANGENVDLLNVRRMENMRFRFQGNNRFDAPLLTEWVANADGGELTMNGGPVTFNAPIN